MQNGAARDRLKQMDGLAQKTGSLALGGDSDSETGSVVHAATAGGALVEDVAKENGELQELNTGLPPHACR